NYTDVNTDSRVALDVRLKADDGFLVILDSNGQVTSSAQMFGDNMIVNGQKYANGFLALQALGAKDCSLTNNTKAKYIGPWDVDLYNNKLKVWIDADRDGRSTTGEIKSLRELGILAINTCNILHAEDKDAFGNGTQMRSTILVNGPGENLADRESEILQRLTSGAGFEGEPAYFRLAIDLLFNVDKDKRCKQ
ncbi:MAG: hypothetical protein IT287_09630, partial [Bdellovibrionaceae bacterium]|nr:hypothetical protein [Pseudobdellovibrionaceae bacterium]